MAEEGEEDLMDQPVVTTSSFRVPLDSDIDETDPDRTLAVATTTTTTVGHARHHARAAAAAAEADDIEVGEEVEQEEAEEKEEAEDEEAVVEEQFKGFGKKWAKPTSSATKPTKASKKGSSSSSSMVPVPPPLKQKLGNKVPPAASSEKKSIAAAKKPPAAANSSKSTLAAHPQPQPTTASTFDEDFSWEAMSDEFDVHAAASAEASTTATSSTTFQYSSSRPLPAATRASVMLQLAVAIPLLATVLYYAILVDNDPGALLLSAYLYLTIYHLSLLCLPLPSSVRNPPSVVYALAQHLQYLYYLGLLPLFVLFPISAMMAFFRLFTYPSYLMGITVGLSNLLLLFLFGLVPTKLHSVALHMLSRVPGVVPSTPPPPPALIRVVDYLMICSNFVYDAFEKIRAFPEATPLPPPGQAVSCGRKYRLTIKVGAWLGMIAAVTFVWVYTRHTQCVNLHTDAMQSLCALTIVFMDIFGNPQ